MKLGDQCLERLIDEDFPQKCNFFPQKCNFFSKNVSRNVSKNAIFLKYMMSCRSYKLRSSNPSIRNENRCNLGFKHTKNAEKTLILLGIHGRIYNHIAEFITKICQCHTLRHFERDFKHIFCNKNLDGILKPLRNELIMQRKAVTLTSYQFTSTKQITSSNRTIKQK